ncbi:33 kDa inner dynein arm light chain, axonemal isoform X2 [Halyomorpha halys]|uniref:33 kDa inner dynein arm light chain, axonemal isoform X2 n=1 Tax=Halyomorpha halys TaxID=286706 RepID=UPI0006D526A8|nr:33 kDa inner dynein arm light chain, axonemal isoform X2 [Halyomorpha halys]
MADRLITPNNTLIKFSHPVLVEEKESYFASGKKDPKHVNIGNKSVPIHAILNCIVKPRLYKHNNQLWKQEVSPEPATRTDVEKLAENLDARLADRQARESGLCPIRNQLYQEAFSELIRQVTVSCGERGILLLRVRDEMQMTLKAYQTLYESSIAFGIRKALLAEKGKIKLHEKIKTTKEEILALEEKVNAMKQKYTMMERRAEELREAEQRKHQEEISFLKKTNAQLKAQLEAIIAPKK